MNNFVDYCMECFSEILTWGGEIVEKDFALEVEDDGKLLTLTDFKNLKQIRATSLFEMERKLVAQYGDENNGD